MLYLTNSAKLSYFKGLVIMGKKLDTFWNVLEEIALERKEAISSLPTHSVFPNI